ncbi:hypothetical protein B0A49_02514 [Cryomyces minteri]|uniref:Nucleolar protein 12 n=1 Tax=Cryomyces minteri TaxID=331657 RepID=A0A4U0XNP4_9PEZI|nr:hypothetical protein B0A49_02514 [Cryomyces minteri]
MDINSLLSPQESPASETPPPLHATPNRRPGKGSRTSSSLSQQMNASPGRQRSTPSLPRNAVAQAQQQSMPSPAITTSSSGITVRSVGDKMDISESRGSVSVGPQTRRPSAQPLQARQPSTPQMDTLADLASMQHHQQTARQTASGLRSNEIVEARHSPSMYTLDNLPSDLPRNNSARSAKDLTMADTPAPATAPRVFIAPSLSKGDLQNIAELVSYLASNPFAFESHARLIDLLHQGLVSHVHPSDGQGATTGDPHTYNLIGELRQAHRFAVMELCAKAIQDEPSSSKLWRSYGDWMWTLYTNANGLSNVAEGWTEDDKIICQESINLETVLGVWQQGIAATQWRLNDSNVVWDRYMEILLQDLAHSPSMEKVGHIKKLFIDRLQVPHVTWDQTSSAFSSFLSTYDNASWEETMVATNQRAALAKHQYALREMHEFRVQRALERRDTVAEWSAFSEYLDWEFSHRKKSAYGSNLLTTLYERATLRFPTNAKLWEDYMEVLVEVYPIGGPALEASERATRHCPWSGRLWSRRLLRLEVEGKKFEDLEAVKHNATRSGLLETGGMEEMLKVCAQWCGFLRRRAFGKHATEDELDIAEVGIRSTLEDVKEIGVSTYGKEFAGDPLYRIERIYIKFLTQIRNNDAARDVWASLIPQHADSHEFWFRYYNWEIFIWAHERMAASEQSETPQVAPHRATEVLRQAILRQNMDWPEKMIEGFVNHFEHHESVQELQKAVSEARLASEQVAKRREREAAEAAAAAASAAASAEQFNTDASMDQVSGSGKRKRDSETLEVGESASKKSRPDGADSLRPPFGDASSSALAQPKRDRENTTVIAKNFPVTATETRVRQFFRECGTINSIKLVPEHDEASATATVEFETKEDAATARTRDGKPCDGRFIEIQTGTGTTLWVTNFPPTADEAFIRELFKDYGEIVDVRFPSLKFDTHRRFCYVQFLNSDMAQAATQLDGKNLGGKHNVVAKISNPNARKDRTGAMEEGREVYIGNLPYQATEHEIQELFEKYGTIESVRIPKSMRGGKGAAFVVFKTKGEAGAALEMNLKIFRDRALKVTLGSATGAAGKRYATTIINSASPEPTTLGNGDAVSPGASNMASSVTAAEIRARTIALLNVPDTVNDARIRSLVERYGPLKKIVLRPDHQGAIVEFENVQDVGKASLGLENHEINPGRHISVGRVEEMLKQKPETKTDKLSSQPKAKAAAGKEKEKKEGVPFMQTRFVERPAQPGGRRGGRGGLGFKRGGLGTGASMANEATERGKDVEMSSATDGVKKSNADFKALFSKTADGAES